MTCTPESCFSFPDAAGPGIANQIKIKYHKVGVGSKLEFRKDRKCTQRGHELWVQGAGSNLNLGVGWLMF